LTAAVHVTRARPRPSGDAATFVGAFGAPTITATDAGDATPVPRALVACTLKVYVVPSVNPLTMRLVPAPAVARGVCAVAPMYGVTV